MSEFLLVGAVAVVGVLHTIVPDHWVPIALIARQRSWSRRETALAALQAGTGHVLSTLLIGLVVWIAGVAVAVRFGQVVETASSIALIAFGGWIAISAWREVHGRGHRHSHGDFGHGAHGHDHGHDHGHSHGDRHSHPHGIAPENDPLYAPLRVEAAILARHTHLHRHVRARRISIGTITPWIPRMPTPLCSAPSRPCTSIVTRRRRGRRCC
jgi:ABC-type nickel/cobalt efflux system permease component RcnA